MRLATANLKALARYQTRFLGRGIAILAVWSSAGLSLAAPFAPTPPESAFARRARNAFHEAQARSKKEPANTQAAWEFARACFDLADIAESNSERAKIANEGIAAAQQALARASNSAPAHYYLGMNLAQLARTKLLGALKIVNQMEREFSIVRELDAKFDQAGADRNLGLLYRDAPSLGSIGSRSKAREHLQQAVALAPPFPENRLNLIESYLNWGDRAGAQRELKALEAVWPSARTNFTGETWDSSWADWEPRLKKAKRLLEETLKDRQAPRIKT